MGLSKHWTRLKRSLGRRWREWRLPRGFARMGTRYGGWWINTRTVGVNPLLIDCGLGEDISFPAAFLARFEGKVVGIEPNPRSLEYCNTHRPEGMEILPNAFWSKAGEIVTFHLPRPQSELPKGADGVSGSLLDSHSYVEGGKPISVATVDLDKVLHYAGRTKCEILKLDIEGAEYEVIDALVRDGKIELIDQLLVEFHHGETHYTFADTENAVHQLEATGMILRHTESRNYIFERARY